MTVMLGVNNSKDVSYHKLRGRILAFISRKATLVGTNAGEGARPPSMPKRRVPSERASATRPPRSMPKRRVPFEHAALDKRTCLERGQLRTFSVYARMRFSSATHELKRSRTASNALPSSGCSSHAVYP